MAASSRASKAESGSPSRRSPQRSNRAKTKKASGSRSDKAGPTDKRPPTRKKPIRYGSEVPRVYTPPLRELTPDTTLGYSVIQFAETILMMTLLPWQKWLLIHMLELLPDDSLRFRTVVVLVARQNGKSTLSQVLGLWFMYVYGIALILGTAQDLDTAEEVWEGAVNLATETDDDENPVRPELADLVEKVVQVNGKKALVVKVAGKKKRWKVKAANRRAGRGLSGDVIFLDELREHQSWDAWGSITKTTIARAFALILCISNAGDSTSIVLRHLRKLGHAAVGDPDGIVKADEEDPHADEPTEEELEEFDDDAADLLDEMEDDDSLGLFEWSARPGRAVLDRDGWCEANPSLGYTIQERSLASAANTDPEWVFRTECLCQWLGGTLSGPFPAMSWEAGRWAPDDPSERPPKIEGPLKACVTMSRDRKTTSITVAGYRADGLPQFEVVAQRAGSAWVRDWFHEDKPTRKRIEHITGRKGGAEGELLKELAADWVDPTGKKRKGLPVHFWAGDELAGWTGLFFDLISAGDIDDNDKPTGARHLPQPALDVAAANAVVKPTGTRFVWDDIKSPVDIHTLIGATGAVGLLLDTTKAPKKKPEARIRTIGG